ncbi:hypothetical protein MAR_031735 [Mya arenaria]|uniref:Integrase core domain-containing protein n=1 Tax=Mya arenaria TaxID=6604 RepID=A0ABY7FCX9_MYAAR|nr:hypothetical protein MAR_031735 [Mya arenaria]
MMHMKCVQNGYCVTQETIRELLHIFYPNGIKHRQQRRLQGSLYLNLGPNYLWHIDGYDGLKPFGICIHGAIDGFSKYVLWLEAYKTNNDPKLISGYYTETVNMMDSCPLRVRADLGTENRYVRDMYLKSITEDHDVQNCYLVGSSNRNQRIERWWGILRTLNVQYWMDFFKLLESNGSYTGDLLDKALVQFCFMDVIQEELDEVRQLWNCHRIRPVRNNISPSGRPVTMYTCPDLYGAQDYLCAVPRANVDSCLEEYVLKSNITCDATVFEICTMIMDDHDFQRPDCDDSVVILYQTLRREILSEISRT